MRLANSDYNTSQSTHLIEQLIITTDSGRTPWTIATPNDYTDVSLPPAWCSFHGVKCGTTPTDVDYRRVTELVLLRNLNLEGSLPVISNLGEMKKLEITSTLISGTIPTSISVMSKLRTLILTMDRLTGTIPSSLGSLAELEVLSLYYCQVTGTIPSSVGSLSKLNDLYLPGNQLSGTIPSSFGLLTNLKKLFIPENKLTGTLPSSLGNMAQLDTITLYLNQLTGTIPSSLNNLAQLQEISLSLNQLSGTIPILNQPSLTALQLAINYLTMGSLAEVPSSTFGESVLRGILFLEENCLKFTHPYTEEYSVEATRCTGEQATNTLDPLII